MPRFLFYKDLLLRSPEGKPNSYTMNVEKILADKVFMSAVSIASPSFHKKISGDKINDHRSLLTLRRYYNRFCFRPTPFGLFASISLTDWSAHRSDQKNGELLLFVTADEHLAYLLHHRSHLNHCDLLEPNPTIYCVQKEFRFVFVDTDVKTGKRQYRLQATDKTAVLARLLKFSRKGKTSNELMDEIQKHSGCGHSEAEEYLEFLTESQFLLFKDRIAITGPPKPFDQFPEVPKTHRFHSKTLLDLQRAASHASDERLSDRPLLNVISFKKRSPSGISAQLEETLDNGIWALTQLTLPLQNPQLKRFAEQFDQHFEGQMIPLLEILDPETGLLYGTSEKEKNNPLLESLLIERFDPVDKYHVWTPVHRMLLNAWHGQSDSNTTFIELDETELKRIGTGKTDLGKAGFSVLFRATGDQAWIESVGGYHTNSLIGRFTLANEAIRDAAKEMAAHEKRLNPDIIFAEILHLTDLHTDNVNRRAQILEMEIPITASSSLPQNRQIPLSDLMVYVQNGKVLLKSKKYGLQVIPRHSSAYNHHINDLPLFRFLLDLPYQHAAPVHSLDLISLFPGLDFYPRVTYKGAVLSPARWILNANEIERLNQVPDGFPDLKNKRKLPDLFMLSEGDQQLLFDSRHEQEIAMFIACISKKAQIMLQEVPTNIITRLPVCEQFNASILPVKPLGLSGVPSDRPHIKLTKRKFVPGSEWLYLKIHITRLGANSVLLQLWPVLKCYFRSGVIRKWFFVRYEDHAPHIRLRLLVDPAQLGQILTEIHKLFDHKVEQNVIRELQLNTYSRELERYGVSNFEKVEDHFFVSSMLVLQYLAAIRSRPIVNDLLFALAVTNELGIAAFQDETRRIDFYEQRFQQFKSEFSGHKFHVELDQKYRSLKSDIDLALRSRDYFTALRLNTRFNICLNTYRRLIENIDPEGVNYQYVISSLIHMHLNRLFITESRMQEMTVFYFLTKYLKGITAKRNRQAHFAC